MNDKRIFLLCWVSLVIIALGVIFFIAYGIATDCPGTAVYVNCSAMPRR
jgi:hypothetical protein